MNKCFRIYCAIAYAHSHTALRVRQQAIVICVNKPIRILAAARMRGGSTAIAARGMWRNVKNCTTAWQTFVSLYYSSWTRRLLCVRILMIPAIVF